MSNRPTTYNQIAGQKIQRIEALSDGVFAIAMTHVVYAHKRGFLAYGGNDGAALYKALKRRIVIAQVLYAIGALLCFVNIYLSIGFILIIQLNYALAIVQRKPGKG